MNTHPLIYTERSRAGYFRDAALTAVGWLFFFLLFASGTFALVTGKMPGPHQMWITSPFFSTTKTLTLYATLAAGNTVLLIAWAIYNYWRFSGKSRRNPTLPLPEEHLLSSFSLSPEQLERTQDARVMVISHEEDSAICGIEIIEQTDTLSPPSHALVATPSTVPGWRTSLSTPVHSNGEIPGGRWWQKPVLLPPMG